MIGRMFLQIDMVTQVPRQEITYGHDLCAKSEHATSTAKPGLIPVFVNDSPMPADRERQSDDWPSLDQLIGGSRRKAAQSG